MQAEVIVTIKPDGKVTIEAEGYTGPTCATITTPYRKALGQELTNTTKPEYWQQEATQQQEISQ
jgi:hypothetical protein